LAAGRRPIAQIAQNRPAFDTRKCLHRHRTGGTEATKEVDEPARPIAPGVMITQQMPPGSPAAMRRASERLCSIRK